MTLAQTPYSAAPQAIPPLLDRPSRRSLLCWGSIVLVLHLGLLLGLTGTLNLQLITPETLRSGPMQTRTIAADSAASEATDFRATPAARTRVALIKKPQPLPPPPPPPPPLARAGKTKNSPLPETALNDEAAQPTPPTAPELGLVEPAQQNSQITADPHSQQDLSAQPGIALAEAQEQPQTPPTVSAAPVPMSAASPIVGPTSAQPAPSASAPVVALPNAATTANDKDANSPSPIQKTAPNEVVQKPNAPERIANATMAVPEVAMASLPPSVLMNYRLTGQEKGINYQATGELRWQRNDNAYAMNLSVRAFLIGARHWRSTGQINTSGLSPTRFSDSWRSERATHFDRPNQRIVFSSNAPEADLQPGAQDQISLYVQLAAAMAQSSARMPPGTRLQIQTATVRDALPWLLTLEKLETLQVNGQSIEAVKWVCQPRNRFDAQVEFWVSAAHNWLPARIRVTQVSGGFIDLQLSGSENLADLPPVQ